MTSLQSIIDCIGKTAKSIGDLDVWIFGSASYTETPNDLDILIIYKSRDRVVELRNKLQSVRLEIPVNLIAMTSTEEVFYDFIRETSARQLL